MNTWRFLIIGLICVSVSCAQPNPLLPQTEILTQANAQLIVETGSRVEIVLPAPSEGNRWQLETGYNAAVLAFDSEREAVRISPEPLYRPNQVFVLRSLAPGQSELRFTQNPDTSVKRAFTLWVRTTREDAQ